MKYLETRKADLLTALGEKKELTDQIKSELNAALKEFSEQFAATTRTAAA